MTNLLNPCPRCRQTVALADCPHCRACLLQYIPPDVTEEEWALRYACPECGHNLAEVWTLLEGWRVPVLFPVEEWQRRREARPAWRESCVPAKAPVSERALNLAIADLSLLRGLPPSRAQESSAYLLARAESMSHGFQQTEAPVYWSLTAWPRRLIDQERYIFEQAFPELSFLEHGAGWLQSLLCIAGWARPR